MHHSRLFACLVAFGAAARLLAATPSPDANNGDLGLPPGFRALVVADDLLKDHPKTALRFLTVAPNGDLYARLSQGGLLALRDTDGDGRFDEKREFGSGGGTGIALHGGWLYFSSNSAVYRYKYTPGQLVPTGEPETIVRDLPDRGQHNAKNFAFGGDGQLYVEVGSPSNAHGNPDRSYMPPGTPPADPTEFLQTHGGFWRFDPDKPNQTQADGHHFSTGHRHSLALAWQPVAREFFMAMMGRDQLNVVSPENYDALDNAERVAEEMHRLRDGVNLGWPYTYWDPIKNARMVAPEFGGDGRKRADPEKFDRPVIAFPAHWAPLQMTFYTGEQFPAKYRNGAFLAFHGSWNRAPLPQDGFNLTFVPFDEKGAPLGSYEVFATNAGSQRYRMGGVAVAPDGSLYLSETDRGRIWRIIYTGETTSPAANPGVSAANGAASEAKLDPAALKLPGHAVYAQYCATCHMADGSGAPPMQPPLAGSPVLAGDVSRVIDVVLRGPIAVLPPERTKYENVMPAFAVLSDQQIADVLTYARAAFVKNAAPITPAQVAPRRSK